MNVLKGHTVTHNGSSSVVATVHGFMKDGGGNTMNVLNGSAHNGSSAVVAAVLHGTLEVLAGDIARAVKTRNKRHCGWDSENLICAAVCTCFFSMLSWAVAAAHSPVGQTNADGCGDRARRPTDTCARYHPLNNNATRLVL